MDYASMILGVGALGTASFSLVDAFKVFGGGPSRLGFNRIETVVGRYLEDNSPIDWKGALRANWMNGMALQDQKAIAKQLIKLDLKVAEAGKIAKMLNLDEARLSSAITNIVSGDPLSDPDKDVYGRFDALLSAQLDEGYQRADQVYRNASKAWAMVASVLLAMFGASQVFPNEPNWVGKSFLIGLLATPLAPVSKDLASGLNAAVKTMQIFKK